jgi:hypothetical protein
MQFVLVGKTRRTSEQPEAKCPSMMALSTLVLGFLLSSTTLVSGKTVSIHAPDFKLQGARLSTVTQWRMDEICKDEVCLVTPGAAVKPA